MTPAEFEKWVQEGVAGRPDTDSAAAGAQARQAITHASKDPALWADPKSAVAAVCRGTMRGIVLLGHDPVAVVVPLLLAVGEAAQDCHLDPAEALGGAMAGIAAVAAVLPAEQQHAMCVAIDDSFTDMGAAFASLCREAASGQG